MRKWVLISVVTLTSCGSLNNSSSSLKNNCSSDSNIDENKLSQLNIVDQGISEEYRQLHFKDILHLPDWILNSINSHEININLRSGNITDFSELNHLKGQPISGFYGSMLWDTIGGVTLGLEVYLTDSIGSNANSVAIHEVSHAIEFASKLSLNKKVKEAFDLYSVRNPGEDNNFYAYRVSNIFEFVAMSMDDYFCNEGTKNKLKKFYPDMYVFLDENLKILLSQ